MKKRINSHLIFTLFSFFIPFIIYLITMAPTTSFWDCGEFIACSVSLGVPHPPGTPLFLLLGNVFSHIPTFTDIGARVNLISPIVSALSVMFLYMIIVQLIERMIIKSNGKKKENYIDKKKLIEYSAFIAALTFSLTDSHWFNAVESEVYSLSTFFTSIVVWLILKWDAKPYDKNSIKYILLISYMMGLAIGVHLLNLLAIGFIVLIIYFNYTNDSLLHFFIDHILIVILFYLFIFLSPIQDTVISFILFMIFLFSIVWSKYHFFHPKMNFADIFSTYFKRISVSIIAILTFIVIYKGVIHGVPNMLNIFYNDLYSNINFVTKIKNFLFPLMILLSLLIGLFLFPIIKSNTVKMYIASILMIFIGFSTYSTIFIRATQHPIINENNPDSFDSFLYYMNREQYGAWNILNKYYLPDSKFTLSRDESTNWKRWTNNKNNPTTKEQLNYFWEYQVKEMYLRYFAWQFIGKADLDDIESSWELRQLDGKLLKRLQGINPARYFIPFGFILGFLGMIFHFIEDRKRAFSLLMLFLATGLMIIVYLNQYDPQPRERDYSYVGSFFAFSIWIGIGIYSIINKISEMRRENYKSISIAISSFLLIIIPVNMLAHDFHGHNRSGNYVAWDYAYNLLNSCEPNSILFTNGDNDTFPLWYIQEVEGLRRDVRVVNLSLLNTNWYIDQLKNEPFIQKNDNYKQLPINLSEKAIKGISPISGTAYALKKWTKVWEPLESLLSNYFKENRSEPYNVSTHGIPYDWTYWGPENKPTEATIIYLDEKFEDNNKNGDWDEGENFKDDNNNSVRDEGYKITFDLKPTISSYLRVQDIMILQLIDDMPSDRPIYFAVTVSPSSRIGLDKYLKMEGLVYRFTHEQADDLTYHPRLNVEKMIMNIMEDNNNENIIRTSEDYNRKVSNNNSPENLGIYRYTNLNSNKIFFNNNIIRLVQNYRSGFLQLAMDFLYREDAVNMMDNINTANKILNSMEKYFPIEIIEISQPDIEIQIGTLFYEVGNMKMFNKYMNHAGSRNDLTLQQSYSIGHLLLENSNEPQLAVDHFDNLFNKYPNIFQIAMGLTISHGKNNDADKGIKIMENWILMHPSDGNKEEAQQWIEILQGLKKPLTK